MANTIMSAKNSFLDGLIMDFSPDNTQATCMTSALNATLLTYNGNEMSLQNDMGNGRVETARLPSGYIPLGTCEFGDIIYIVSYNPITNKSQIGCFPSPERNISSEEIGLLQQRISTADFLTGVPGEIRATSVKKIIFERNLNPGDKYIVYSSQELQYSGDRITDFGNTGHVYGGWPKIVQLHLVAIEDSGKINYLSSAMVLNSANSPANANNNNLKWYSNIIPAGGDGGGDGEGDGGGGGGGEDPSPDPDPGTSIPVTGGRPRAAMFMVPRLLRMGRAYAGPNDYYIQQVKDNNLGSPDLDSYRNLVDSAYLIFQSKVSGKLAIIAELEKISGFSCTHTVYSEDLGNGQKNFKVYLNSSWITDNVDVNPSGFVVLDSYWKDADDNGRGSYIKSDGSDSGNTTVEYVGLPVSANTSYLDDKFVFSSAYDLANPGLYTTYINNTCHKKQVEIFENIYKTNADKDLNYAPRKATQILENNIPAYTGNKGKYYINAFAIDKENGVHFVNNEGIKVKVQGDYIQELNDTFVHHYFGKDIIKPFYELNYITNYVTIGNNTKYYSDLTNLVHTYTVCPAMPYGYLGEYAITNSIDFSKVGSGFINLDEWRYYNDGEVSTLTFGIEAYPEENKGISKVELEFYDNNGKAAVLKLHNRISYSGNFTEVFQFNSDSNRNLSGEGFTHRGDGPYVLPDDATTEDVQNMSDMVKKGIYLDGGVEDGKQLYYINDAGMLYPNLLYLVKINIYYLNKNALGEFDENVTVEPVVFTRWFWSNSMYNEYYHNVNDFLDLKIDLNLNLEVAFEENNNLNINNKELLIRNTLPETYTSEYPIPLQYLSLGYHKYTIGSDDGKPNLRMAIMPSLNEAYDTFSLNAEVFNYLHYKIWEGKSFIEAPETVLQKTMNESEFIKYPDLLYPIVSKDENGNIIENAPLEIPVGDDKTELDFNNWAKSLKDWFTLTVDPTRGKSGYESVEYVNFKDEVNMTPDLYYDVSAGDMRPENTTFSLLLQGEFYSKIMANMVKETEIPCNVYRPFIKEEEDLLNYNIIKTNNATQFVDSPFVSLGFSFLTIYNISLMDKYGHASCYYGTTSTDGGYILLTTEPEGFGLTLVGPVTPSKDKVKVSISDVLFANAVDIGPFSILSTVPGNDSNGSGRLGIAEKWKMNPTKNFERILTDVEPTWFTNWGSGEEKYRIQEGRNPEGYVHDDGSETFTFLLVGRDTTGRYVPFNAFARHLLTLSKLATQVFGRRSSYGGLLNLDNVGGYTSFAQIIASFLSQLYYKSNIEYSKKVNVFDDLVINLPYSELWCKEFIILAYVHNNDDIPKMFNILGIPYNEYINGIYNNYSDKANWNSINKNNVTIDSEVLLKQSNLVLFVHTLNYDYQELLSNYELTQGRVIYVETDVTKTYGGMFVSEAPQDEVLALDFEKNTLSSFYLVKAKILKWKDDGLYWEDLSLEKLKLEDLAQRLTVKDEIATLKNIPITNNIYKGTLSSDDSDEMLALGFNSGIVLNSIFKI